MICIADSLEYSSDNFKIVKSDETEWSEDELALLTDTPNKDFVGLYKEYSYVDSKFIVKPHYYIGYRWFNKDKKEYIHIAPKQKDRHVADYLAMFLECLKDPVVSKHLGDTYEIFFNEEWIDIEEQQDEITPLLILQFLKVVNDIAKKGLKKGYIKITENLTSKVKGRILVNETIKHNHFKNRLDKTICHHQTFTTNCIENQILKTALLQCSRNLHGVGDNKDITKLLRFNLNSFELVDTKEVFHSDFSKIKHSPFYKEYKEALKLANMIFKRFGFTLNSSIKTTKTKIPPFYIDMPELFERYVQVQLSKKYKDDLIPGYGMGNGYKTSIGELRPDFIVKGKQLIIDAKYKYWFSGNKDNRFKEDYQQLSLYGRAKGISKDIGLLENQEAELLFIYPKIGGSEIIDNNFEAIHDFSNIKTLGINIPTQKVSL